MQDFEAKPLVAATALAGGAAVAKSRKQSRKEARQGAKKKKKGGHADSPEVEETLPTAPVVEEAVAEPFVAESAAEAVAESAVAESAVAESVVHETVVEETFAETPVVEETRAEELVATQPAVEEAPVDEPAVAFEEATPTEQAEEAAAPEPTVEAPAFEESPAEVVAETPFVATEEVAAVEPEAAPTVTEIAPVVPEEIEAEAAAPEVAEPEAVEAEAPAAVTQIEPAVAPEPERVQAETRLLLEGGDYDRGVIGTRDPVARQMIAAELLSALAGRNPQRRERAGAIFVEQGYYDETARDLREADAPAERAAAARSLALFGDRAATPLLIAALEDPMLDVRRAAVEALGALRDPSAVAPLEALLERERTERNRIPPRVIRNAAETCREAANEPEPVAEAPQVLETAVEPAHVAEPERREVEVEEHAAAGSVEIAPADEPIAEIEQEQPAEVAVSETVEEAPVSLAPFVEEREQEPAQQTAPAEEVAAAWTQTAEPVSLDDGRADEEETTLVAEAPAAAAEVDPLVADLSEELNAVESRSFETVVAEPQAVVETGVKPFVEGEEHAEEVTQTDAWAPVEEAAVEPFREPADEEFTSYTPEPAAEPGQAALFDEAAAEEVTREVAPFGGVASDEPAVASGGDIAADDWFDFDMKELREEPRHVEAEAAPSPSQEHVFESSSGETLTSYAEADAGATTAEVESPSFADVQAELTREVEASGAGEYEREEAAPAATGERGIAPFDELSTVPASIQQRLASGNPDERAAAIVELSHVDTDETFQQICAGFDDASKEVRNAAARALYELRPDRAESFTRALREATPERRREIGAAISSSGLAGESISQLTGESRERTYEAFSLLFLMAKAGEVQPLVRAIEGHPNNEVRLAVVKLLALSGQKEILPAFRRLAVRGSLPTEVRSAVMEAIYQISSSQPTPA